MFRKALIAATLAVATLTAGLAGGTTSASANDLNSNIAGNAPITQTAATPTDSGTGFGKRKFKFKFAFKKRFKHHGGYGYKCRWLKKKFHHTGNYHWLKKYKRCMYRYY